MQWAAFGAYLGLGPWSCCTFCQNANSVLIMRWGRFAVHQLEPVPHYLGTHCKIIYQLTKTFDEESNCISFLCCPFPLILCFQFNFYCVTQMPSILQIKTTSVHSLLNLHLSPALPLHPPNPQFSQQRCWDLFFCLYFPHFYLDKLMQAGHWVHGHIHVLLCF